MLPWVKVGFLSANGTDGDGVLTLLLGIGIALISWLSRRPTRAAWILLVLAGLATAIGVYDVGNITAKGKDLGSGSTAIHISASVGIGLWLTVVAAVAVLVGAVMGLRDAKRSRKALVL
jgi:hypothetical protein